MPPFLRAAPAPADYASTTMIRLILHLAIPCLVVLLASCAELAKHADIIKPTARLSGTRLANINFEQADLVFDLAIENQNPIAINLAGLNYDLKIEEQTLVSGVSAEDVEIKPVSTSAVQLPISLKFDELKKLPGKIWQQDYFAYQLDTEFVVDLPVIGHYTIPVSQSGELPVPKLPAVRLANLQLKSLNLMVAEIVAQVEIDNPNAFDLAFSDFNYQLNINQQPWGQGSVNKGSRIPKKQKGVVAIPFTLNIASLGQAAYRLLMDRQPLQYQLTGEMTLDTGIEMMEALTIPIDDRGTTSPQ